MPSFANRYATPLITGLFLVSLVSGVALFFHWGQAWFHSMHEWLSMVLILPFVLHLWKNWRPMRSYLKRRPMWLALAASVAMAALFVIPTGSTTGSGGRPPQFAFAEAMMQATPAEIAAVLDTTPEAVTAGLQAAGITATADRSLRDSAAAGGQSTGQVMAALLAPSR